MENKVRNLNCPGDIECPKDLNLSMVMCNPSLNKNIFESQVKDSNVILVVVYASGTSPEWLAPIVKEKVKNNVSVIFLSDNYGDDYGVIQLQYLAGYKALENGAVLLQKVNSSNGPEVQKEIFKGFKEGKRGAELSQYVYNAFSYKPGEKIPKAEWEREEGIQKMKELTENTLRRTGEIANRN